MFFWLSALQKVASIEKFRVSKVKKLQMFKDGLKSYQHIR